jgi:hypothetical protein
LNFAVLLVDSLLTCSSLFILHGLYFVLYALTFILFSVIFFAAKGRNENNEKFIYSSLDWDGAPGAAAVTVVALLFVAVPIVYLFLWTIVFARCAHESTCPAPHFPRAFGGGTRSAVGAEACLCPRPKSASTTKELWRGAATSLSTRPAEVFDRRASSSPTDDRNKRR